MLVNILNPSDQVYTDSTRLTTLSIVNAILETSGTVIGDYPSLATLLADLACKYLFQLARSDNPGVLQASLRVIVTLLETMRPHLKLQQEFFLTFTIDRLAIPPAPKSTFMRKTSTNSLRQSTPSTPALPANADLEPEKGSPSSGRPVVQPVRAENRDLVLEMLWQISRYPSFMVDMYTNYDCDINCESLFERLVEFLTKVRF